MLTKTTVASSSTLACFQIGVLQKTSKLSNVPENGKKIANIQDLYSGNFKCVPPILITVLFHSVLCLSL